jgi:PAS domain S-box-containing protein
VATRIQNRGRPSRYAAALILVFAATMLRAALDPLLEDQAAFSFQFVAVVIISWFAGFEAGLVAAFSSALSAAYFFMQPRHSLALQVPGTAAGAIVYTATAVGLAWLTSRWSAAERAAAETHEALESRERLSKALMDASTDSISLIDRAHVLVVNAAAARRLGKTADELRGVEFRRLFPALAAERGRRVEQVFATGQAVQFEDERGGICFEHTLYPAFGPTGEVVAIAVFSRDVTEQRRAESERREISERLAYHVENSPLGVIEFGPDVRVTRWAGAAERLFGWSADEVLGKRIDEFHFVYEEDAAQVRSAADDLWTGADPRRFSANRNYRKDGQVVWCEWYNSALHDESGNIRSILALVLDVTGRTRLEQELRTQAQQLATVNRVKDDFLATLSHELRTPLNAILGWTQILGGATLNESRLRQGLETIRRNARLQAQMIEDLLDVSRIVTGSLRLAIHPFGLRAAVEEAIDGIRPAAEAKQIIVSADVESGLTLSADQVRVQQVLWNLLSNAVKFTPPGGTVRVSARRVSSAIEIGVSDTGIGVPKEFVPHIFERFRQADSSPTREHGGLGLGLAIVRHIVELHGGTVSAASEGPGRGAVFTIRMPVGPAAAPVADVPSQAPAAAAQPRGALLDGVRVLVVDDDADARDMTATIFDAVGAVVLSAASASEALAAMPSFHPHVMVSDIAMPGMDGYQFIRELRSKGSPYERLCAVALTAYGGSAAKDAALDAGYDRYLAKPVVVDQLIATITSLVDRSPRALNGTTHTAEGDARADPR